MFEVSLIFDAFIKQLIDRGIKHAPGPYLPKSSFDICSIFFAEVAAALKALDSKITIEVLCGGLPEELSKMKFKCDSHRPANFPRSFDRMWMSNVP